MAATTASLPLTAPHTDWLLTPERVAIHRATATAVLADLHLGYDLARRWSGEAVPLIPLEETLAPLVAVRGRHRVQRLVIAGDLLEGKAGHSRAAELADWLRRSGIDRVEVVPGNHDRSLGNDIPALAICPNGVEVGSWLVLHGDGRLPRRPVVHGHLHPCLRWRDGITAPCYLTRPNRLVLPAFSADAAGTNVLRQPGWRGYRCLVVTGEQVLDFGEARTLSRRLDSAQHRLRSKVGQASEKRHT